MIKQKIAGIIVAAGSSTRYGQNSNKNLEIIEGKPVVQYSIEAFEKNENINEVIVAIKEEERELFQPLLQQVTKPISLVIGGASRQESVYHCLLQTNADIVIIQDGARPMIKQQYIDNLLEEMKQFKGATIGVRAKDTIKVTDDNGVVIQTTKRKNTWQIQTPQCFERNTLLEMHEKWKDSKEMTDDCMLLEEGGIPVKIIEGDEKNIKLTTQGDKKLIVEFLKQKE